MNIVTYIAAFLFAIGLLVAVHEFGHYWVAKKLGFKVLRFSIGFGKPLITRIGKDADHTEYCLSAIPLGGYVKMLDEREGEVAAHERERAFNRRPVRHRIAVLLAGPAMNLLFAALAYAVLGMIGTDTVKPVVGQVWLDRPAALAGLLRGDEILSVNERKVGDIEDLQIALFRELNDNGLLRLRVRRGDIDKSLLMKLPGDARSLTEPGRLLPGLGFDLSSWNAQVLVNSVPSGSAGAAAGLVAHDRVLAVDGQSVANAGEFKTVISNSAGQRVRLEVLRAGTRQELVANVPEVLDQGVRIGRLGIALEEGPRSWPAGLVTRHRDNVFAAIGAGFVKTYETSVFTLQMMARIITGQVSPKNISGVISIAEFAGVSAALGVTAFLGFLAMISVSLGVLNLLPVPLLDGGQVVYQLVEAVKGRPLSQRAQLFGQQVGIALLLVLMSLAFYNDISRHLN